PVLGELHAGPGELAGILLELSLEPLEQREGIGRGAREAGDDVALAQPAHLARIALDPRLPEADLPVAPDHHLAALAAHQDGGAAADQQDGGGVEGRTGAAVLPGLVVEIHGYLTHAGLYLGHGTQKAIARGLVAGRRQTTSALSSPAEPLLSKAREGEGKGIQ